VSRQSYRGRHRTPGREALTSGPDRLYEIDLLRITAALAVVVYHYTFSGWAGRLTSITFPTLSIVTRYGYLGVDLFFTISGFVVLLSAWGREPHQFVISRIVRLYPAYWIAVTITAVIAVTLSRGLFHVSASQYVANLTMMNSLPNIANVDVVYWTLWAEIRFYLLVFALAWIGITRRRVIGLLWLWLGATAVMESGVIPSGPAAKLDLLVQSQWSHYFVAGMALCMIHRSGWSWHLGVVLALAEGNAAFRAVGFGRRVATRYQQTLHPAVIVTVVTMILVVMLLIALRVTRRIARPWFAVAGALTYPLYLVHAYNGFVMFDRFGRVVNKWVLLVATIALMASAAYAIHRFVEKPLAPRLKRALVRLSEGTHIARPVDIPRQPTDDPAPVARPAPDGRREPTTTMGTGAVVDLDASVDVADAEETTLVLPAARATRQ